MRTENIECTIFQGVDKQEAKTGSEENNLPKQLRKLLPGEPKTRLGELPKKKKQRKKKLARRQLVKSLFKN
jgi:hypothetical protein